MGMPKKYQTEEERKAAHRECQRQYYQKNPEKVKECNKLWNEKNPEKIKEYQKRYYRNNTEKKLDYLKEYRNTPMGRASNLVNRYQQSDKEHNRGECTLTPEWIVDNIFTQKCHWCPETDWRKLGCDRIDNSKPHTPDNVVPCCEECNKKRGTKTYEEFILDTILI